jgi:hypothetical protein
MYLVVSAVKIGAMILLIDRLSIYGVIVASGASAVIEIILLRFTIGNRFTFSFNPYKILIAPLILFVLIVTIEPVWGQEFPWTIHSLYLLVTSLVLWWVYRNEITLINPMKVIRQ